MKGKTEKIREILAQNIKKRRESLGMTQDKLAEITDLSVQTINTIEGCRMWISDKSITRIARALDVEIFQLFMPDYININKLDTGYIAVLLEFWQKSKLVIKDADSQLDIKFNEVLELSGHLKNQEEVANPKPHKYKSRR